MDYAMPSGQQHQHAPQQREFASQPRAMTPAEAPAPQDNLSNAGSYASSQGRGSGDAAPDLFSRPQSAETTAPGIGMSTRQSRQPIGQLSRAVMASHPVYQHANDLRQPVPSNLAQGEFLSRPASVAGESPHSEAQMREHSDSLRGTDPTQSFYGPPPQDPGLSMDDPLFQKVARASQQVQLANQQPHPVQLGPLEEDLGGSSVQTWPRGMSNLRPSAQHMHEHLSAGEPRVHEAFTDGQPGMSDSEVGKKLLQRISSDEAWNALRVLLGVPEGTNADIPSVPSGPSLDADVPDPALMRGHLLQPVSVPTGAMPVSTRGMPLPVGMSAEGMPVRISSDTSAQRPVEGLLERQTRSPHEAESAPLPHPLDDEPTRFAQRLGRMSAPPTAPADQLQQQLQELLPAEVVSAFQRGTQPAPGLPSLSQDAILHAIRPPHLESGRAGPTNSSPLAYADSLSYPVSLPQAEGAARMGEHANLPHASGPAAMMPLEMPPFSQQSEALCMLPEVLPPTSHGPTASAAEGATMTAGVITSGLGPRQGRPRAAGSRHQHWGVPGAAPQSSAQVRRSTCPTRFIHPSIPAVLSTFPS